MRPIRLKIKNIASFRGEQEVDFLEIQKITSLFAISGETGAGKSTILNSIALALYGDVYKKNVNQLDLVTLGEKEGSIEFLFEANGKYYLADWRARVKKQNGESYTTPRPPTRTLYSIKGTSFNDEKIVITKNIVDLLNLNFDQFCKCIILNQGEFARFLTSSFTERKEILEKLYPGEVLESMGKELKKEIDLLEKEKNEAQIRVSELSGEEISGEELLKRKNLLTNKLSELENIFKNTEHLERHFTSLQTYYDKIITNKQKKEIITKEVSSQTSKYNELLVSGDLIQSELEETIKESLRIPHLQILLKKEEKLQFIQEQIRTNENEKKGKEKELIQVIKDLNVTEEEINNLKITFKEKLEKTTIPFEEYKNNKEIIEQIFEVFAELELTLEELKGKSERLKNLEEIGIRLKDETNKLKEKIQIIPESINEKLKHLESEKERISIKISNHQRLQIRLNELIKQYQEMKNYLVEYEEKSSQLLLLISKCESDLLPLEATLKIEEFILAKKTCALHALKVSEGLCPVCESNIEPGFWVSLTEKLNQDNLEDIRLKHSHLVKNLFEYKSEKEHFLKKKNQTQTALESKDIEIKSINKELELPVPDIQTIEKEIDELRKKIWQKEHDIQNHNSRLVELEKVKSQYSNLKKEFDNLTSISNSKKNHLTNLTSQVNSFLGFIDRDSLRALKYEIKVFNHLIEIEIAINKLTQQEHFFNLQKEKAKTEIKEKTSLINSFQEDLTKIKEELISELGDESAHNIISRLSQNEQIIREKWQKHQDEIKKCELIIKDTQGRLHQIDELIKDTDLQMTQELHRVHEFALLSTKPEINSLSKLQIDYKSEKAILLSFFDLIKNHKEFTRIESNDCRMELATASTKLNDWERVQDKIKILSLTIKDIQTKLQKKFNLFEILGKDELRTFVLSLVEEHLINYTNHQLLKLCQGRYEIVHQTRSFRMTPEFYVLDKYREGGIRKVSTLSGGETFMVSLAMALALAEMTRGQAEIDSLFIDEGFGSLDEHSLDDVMNMLHQIQNRGLLVGIISHIKNLSQALPVNLVLNKKTDGSSNINIQYN